jgi:hypothetical protein
VNAAASTVNARGPSLVDRLHDILAGVQEVSLHGVHRGAAVALATVQVQTGHDLISMEHGFLASDDPDTH